MEVRISVSAGRNRDVCSTSVHAYVCTLFARRGGQPRKKEDFFTAAMRVPVAVHDVQTAFLGASVQSPDIL